jgi:hypothetical protein
VAAVRILLAVLLWIVLAIIGLLLVLIAAVLFLPVDFGLRLDVSLRPDDESEWGISGSARWSANLRWGWWLFTLLAAGDGLTVSELSTRLFGLRLRARRRERAPEKTPGKKKQKQWPSLSDLRSFAQEGLRLVQRLIAAMRLRLRGDLVFGFSDPSVTGMTLAAVSVTGTPGELRLHPDWLDPHFEGWLEAEGRIYGYEVGAALWTAYWRSPLGDRLRKRLRGIFKRNA